MTNYERIARASNFKSWDDMVEAAKDKDVEFVVPPYLFYGPNANFFLNVDIPTTLKQMSFKLTIRDEYKLFLTRDLKSDIIEPQNKEGE
jgi:hypothetical protein